VSSIVILDRVTLPADEARAWVDRMHAEYAPAARERGMQLNGTWSSNVDADAVEVCILWQLPDIPAFWRMRAATLADASVDAWWASTDAVALERHRRAYAAVDPS
jgi:hypothetical protein